MVLGPDVCYLIGCSFVYTLQGPSNFAIAPQLEVARAQLSWLGKLWWSVCEAVLDMCRLAHLLIIFLPLLTLSPFVLNRPKWRRRWQRHFRC